MTTARLKVAFLLAAVSLTGCWLRQPAGEFEPIKLQATQSDSKVDYSGLDAVLKAAIGPGGEIKPEELKDNEKMLEGQLMLMTVVGPKTRSDLFDSDHSKLNYWYNARAAWSLRLLLTFSRERLEADDVKQSPDDRWEMSDDGVPLEDFRNRSFPIDGRSMTLALMDSLIIEQFGFKAGVGAPCVSMVRAAIPKKSFDGKDVAELADKRFNEFVDHSKRFVMDVEARKILVPPILWRFGDKLIGEHERKYGTSGVDLATALLPHVRLSPHRRLQDAVGYRCVEADEPDVPLIVKRKDD